MPMHVEVYGPEDGVPVVFLHGSMVASWMWLGQVEDLSEYRCFLPDLPGMGKSADIPWVSFSDTSDKIANMIATRCAGGKAHIVGLSLGGVAALYTAVKHPHVVESLIISGVPYGKVPKFLRLLSHLMLKLYSRSWGARMIAILFGIPRDESMKAFILTAAQTDPMSLKKLTKEIFEKPLPDDLDKVTARTLAVAGARDTKIARQAVSYLQDTMPNAAGYIVPEVGHQWNAENTKLFSEMIKLWITLETVNDKFIRI